MSYFSAHFDCFSIINQNELVLRYGQCVGKYQCYSLTFLSKLAHLLCLSLFTENE